MTTRARKRLEAMYEKDRPLVFAHRGAMAYAPMNTIPAFELAYEQGADGIELDVWLSMDDVPVVIHDFEYANTTDGEGRVGITPLEELKALDAGSWFDEQFSGAEIPTLEEVFEAVGQKLFINIEVKSISLETANIVQQTVDRIRKHQMSERVLISSFNPLVLRQMRKLAPEMPIGFLQSPDDVRWIKWLMTGTAYEAWHPHADQVTEAVVKRAKKRGQWVNAWTVNDAEAAKRLRDFGIDGLITDKPDVILAALQEDV